ncbi:MAG: DUF1934 domain-containing protein [Lachnospiraceae bacterium]|nr:DUF1934 domain-containing protein [Lachnospiraceae bacterium]
MKKDVLLTIKGRHKERGGDWEGLEVMTTGVQYEKNGSIYLVYDEIMGEEDSDVSHNRIKIEQEPLTVTMTKSGAVVSVMSFGENIKENSNYETPFGSFTLGVDTREISFINNEEELRLQIRYSLEMNYEYLSESDICIEAKPCETAVL